MPSKTSKKTDARGGVLRGSAYGLLLIAAMLAVYAVVIKYDSAVYGSTKWVLPVINLSGAVICGAVAASAKGRVSLAKGLISGLILSAVVIILSFLIADKLPEIKKTCELLLITLCGTAIGTAADLCISNKKLRKRSKRRA